MTGFRPTMVTGITLANGNGPDACSPPCPHFQTHAQFTSSKPQYSPSGLHKPDNCRAPFRIYSCNTKPTMLATHSPTRQCLQYGRKTKNSCNSGNVWRIRRAQKPARIGDTIPRVTDHNDPARRKPGAVLNQRVVKHPFSPKCITIHQKTAFGSGQERGPQGGVMHKGGVPAGTDGQHRRPALTASNDSQH